MMRTYDQEIFTEEASSRDLPSEPIPVGHEGISHEKNWEKSVPDRESQEQRP